jgi:hypothetical protein
VAKSSAEPDFRWQIPLDAKTSLFNKITKLIMEDRHRSDFIFDTNDICDIFIIVGGSTNQKPHIDTISSSVNAIIMTLDLVHPVKLNVIKHQLTPQCWKDAEAEFRLAGKQRIVPHPTNDKMMRFTAAALTFNARIIHSGSPCVGSNGGPKNTLTAPFESAKKLLTKKRKKTDTNDIIMHLLGDIENLNRICRLYIATNPKE